MLEVTVQTYFGLKGAEIVNWGGDGNEGLKIFFAIEAGTERQAIKLVASVIEKTEISWLRVAESGWTIDLEELKKLILELTEYEWIKGTVRVTPEFEPEEIGSRPGALFVGSVTCTVTPELVVSSSKSNPEPHSLSNWTPQISASRTIVQEILDGKRKKYPIGLKGEMGDSVVKYDPGSYVEFFSANLVPGMNIPENHPERDAIRVMVLVEAVDTSSLHFFISWKLAVPFLEVDPDGDQEEESFIILRLICQFSEHTVAAIPAFPISRITGLSPEVVEDDFDFLSEKGFIKLIQTSGGGTFAFIESKGRRSVREKRMAKPIVPVLPVEITESLAKFKQDHPDERKAAFIMMRFGSTASHDNIVEAIRSALKPHGIVGLRADDKEYDPNLFTNIKTYMHGCGVGIAVFERIETEDFNPNVSLEVGYMIALKRPVCLLKDKTLKALHTDLGGLIYRPFDTLDPGKAISIELGKWLSDKSLD